MKSLTVLLGAVVFVVTLLLNAPASLLPVLLRAGGFDISLLHVEGSLWRGHIETLQFRDGAKEYFVDSLRWQWSPWSLLGGQVCINVLDAKAEAVTLKGVFCVDRDGVIAGEQIEMRTRVRNALRLASFPLPVDGRAALTMPSLEWSSEMGFAQLEGVAEIADYGYQVAGQQNVLGDYRLKISAIDADNVLIAFQPSQAKISLQGEVVVSTAGSYDANLQFIPQPEASQALVDSLKFLAVPQEDGSYRFKYSGRF